jgi:hypothetical protein
MQIKDHKTVNICHKIQDIKAGHKHSNIPKQVVKAKVALESGPAEMWDYKETEFA